MENLRNIAIIVCGAVVLFELLMAKSFVDGAMTMAQMEKTMETMRSVCGPKNKLSDELIEGLKKGQFLEDNKDLKCYTLCVAQMSGTLTKKNELSTPKTLSQIENLIPLEIKEHSLKVFNACKDVQNGYKDPCDKLFFTTKCMYDFDPAKFIFP